MTGIDLYQTDKKLKRELDQVSADSTIPPKNKKAVKDVIDHCSA